MSKVRLAFIGCGGIVRQHLEHGLKNFPDVEFAAWCDLNAETAAARREQVGGQGTIYTDAREMLDQAKPDAVYIMLPPYAHGPTEDLVLERKLPFFVEKPVAIDLVTAEKVAEGVQKHSLLTAVGYMNRYRKSTLRVRALLQEQKPVLMHGGWLGGGPKAYEGIWKWWVQKDKSGGQFLEQTTHTIDLARYLFGDVKSIYAVAVRDRKERPDFFTIEDASMVQLAFANGAAANLYSSCSTSLGGGVSLTVWGTDLRAQFTGWEHSVKIYLPDDEQITIPGKDNIFSLEDRAFVDSVKAGKNAGILATYKDGLKATAIACAASESMETGQVVDLA
jgi:predicted dehydrogenase